MYHRGLLDNEEMIKLKTALESDDGILKHHYAIADGEGKAVSFSLRIFLDISIIILNIISLHEGSVGSD